MPPNPPFLASPDLSEGITVKRHALGELVKSLLKAAEREEALYEQLRDAHAKGERETVFSLVGELLSLRPAPELKPENCTDTAA